MKEKDQELNIEEILNIIKNEPYYDAYNKLITKYKKETKELIDQQNLSIEYFIYKNIDSEDRDKYLEMAKNYFMLDNNFRKNYKRKGIHRDTAEIIKKEIVKEMLKNPKDMESIMNKYLSLLKNESKFFRSTNMFINSKGILSKAKKKHIDDYSLYFLKEISKAYSNNENLYKQIIQNKKLNQEYSNSYFQNISKKIPELKKEITLLKEKYNENKKEFINIQRMQKLDKMDMIIINEVLKFLRDNESNTFNSYIRRKKVLTNYSYDEIINKTKKIDINLYNSIKKKEIKRYEIILDYFKNEYSSFEHYLKTNNITKKMFEKVLNEVKKYDILTYQKFIDKYNKESIKYNENAKEALTICHKIVNGKQDAKGNIRKYNFLDYNLDTKLTLNEFNLLLRNKLKIEHNDLIKVCKFISEQLYTSCTKVISPHIISDERINRENIGINGRIIKDYEKEAILKYMDEHNFIKYEKLYEQIIRSYFNGELDLSPYINTNIKKLKK